MFSFSDTQHTPAALETQARQALNQRGYTQADLHTSLPSYGSAVDLPPFPAAHPTFFNLYQHLRLTNQNYFQVENSPILAPSPATRVPLLGRVWSLIRSQAHQLILFYLNRSAAHTIEVHGQMVCILNELTRVTIEQQTRLQQLEQEVQQLRQQLEDKNE
jgi:hypothetical protein